MLKVRVSIGILLLLASIFFIWWGVIPVTIECLLIGWLGYSEFVELLKKKGIKPSLVIGILGITALLFSTAFFQQKFLLPIFFLTAFLVFIHFIFRKDYHPQLIFDVAGTILGVLYLGGFLSFVILLRELPGRLSLASMVFDKGAVVLAFTVLLNAATDVGSFFVGKFRGRIPLCPQISPGKTIEGAIGGLLAALLFGLLLGGFLQIPWLHRGLLALVISFSAQLGDLWESVLKRDAGVKDSGNLLFAHGGVLDRFDSLLFSAPLAFLYWQYFLGA